MHELKGVVGPEGHLDYAMQHINVRPCALHPMIYNMQQGIHCLDTCPFAFCTSSEIQICTWFQLLGHVR